MSVRTCTRCRISQLESAFWRRSDGRCGGFQSYCKTCEYELKRVRRAAQKIGDEDPDETARMVLHLIAYLVTTADLEPTGTGHLDDDVRDRVMRRSA